MKISYLPAILLTSLLLVSCSTVSTVTPDQGSINQSDLKNYTAQTPVFVSDYDTSGNACAGKGVLGIFHVYIDTQNVLAELVPLRNTSLTDTLEVVDITNFLMLAPCTDCATIQSVSMDIDGKLDVSIGVKHPFAAGDPLKPISGKNRGDLHVFNVEGIVAVNTDASTNFSSLGQVVSNYGLDNADGFTGYLDPHLEQIFPTDATVHPFITHFDDYSQGNFDPSNPMGFASVTDPPPSGNLVMPMGSDYDYQDYIFDIPENQEIEFIYAVGCTYAVSAASKTLRFEPEYRIPQHNKKAASEVSVEIISNHLASGDPLSTAEIEIHVVDINHGVETGTALGQMLADSSVGSISIEIPGVESGVVIVDISSPGGTGHEPSDPLVFTATITNSANADQGIYTGLVKVTDSYTPGLNESLLLDGMDGIKRVDPGINPLEGLFPIPEFTTYQIFDMEVLDMTSIEVITPNGGESWVIGHEYEITWTWFGNITDVRIDYSTDSGMTYPYNIIPSTPNDGSFDWTIPNTPSTEARVRIQTATGDPAEDESDDDFIISEFEAGPGATPYPYFDGFGPTGTSDDPIPTEWNVMLNASDITGDISDYLWEFSGDDQYDDATGQITTISFPNPGVFDIKLKVLYTGGGEDYYNFAGPYYITLGTYTWAAFSGTSDGSRSNPYPTITDALAAVSTDGYILVRGDDGAGGQCTYTANLNVDDSKEGTRIQGYYGDYATDEPPEQTGYVILDGNNTTFDGFEVTGPANYTFPPFGNRAKIALYNTDNSLFRHIYAHDIGGSTRVFWCFEYQGPDNSTGTFQNCLQADMNVTTMIHNASHDDSQSTSTNFPSTYITNCTFDRFDNFAWGYYVSGGWTTVYVRNCIWTDIAGSGAYYLRTAGAFMYAYYNNVYDNPSIPPNGGMYYSNVNVDPSCFIEDPLYVDYMNDHHLSSGSPCIDAGDPDPQYNDYDGTRNDLGCYGGPYGDWDFEN